MPTLVYKKNVLSGSSIGLAKEFNSTNSELKAASAKLLDEVKNDLDEVEENLAKEIAEQAYIHPTTSGYKHIPTGGKKGNILKWDEDGTAVWEDDISQYEMDGFLSRNLFDSKTAIPVNARFDGNVVYNSITDTKDYFHFAVQAYNGTGTRIYQHTKVTSTGRVHITCDTSSADAITHIYIKHVGTNQDLGIIVPFTYKGIFTVSINVLSLNPIVVDGIVFDNIQIEKGDKVTPYRKPAISNVDITNKLGNVRYIPMELGTLTWAEGELYATSDRIRSVSYISVLPNSKYVIRKINNNDLWVAGFSEIGKLITDKTVTYLGWLCGTTDSQAVFTTSPTTRYIKFTCGTADLENNANLSIELLDIGDGIVTLAEDVNDINARLVNFSKSGSGAKAGLVPAPSTTAGTTKYLREDGTWQVPPDNNTVYSHPTTSGNKHIPAGGSSGQILRWGSDGTAVWGADNNTTYSAATQSANGLMSAADKKKLDGIATSANAYTHPTTAGNKHIPAGGSSGQILRWSADGTAVWGADNNTTYSVATQSANGLMSAADKKKVDGLGTQCTYSLSGTTLTITTK